MRWSQSVSWWWTRPEPGASDHQVRSSSAEWVCLLWREGGVTSEAPRTSPPPPTGPFAAKPHAPGPTARKARATREKSPVISSSRSPNPSTTPPGLSPTIVPPSINQGSQLPAQVIRLQQSPELKRSNIWQSEVLSTPSAPKWRKPSDYDFICWRIWWIWKCWWFWWNWWVWYGKMLKNK